jgi:hypothetical protein
MMEYRRIRISYKEAKDRFYRVLDIRNDLNLVYSGVIFATALNCEFEHDFMFRCNRQGYVPDSLMSGDYDRWAAMKDCCLKDLDLSFEYEYDTGDGWEFDCETESVFEKDDVTFAYLIEGKGQGIWEDNRYSLDMYLEGKVSPKDSYSENDEMIQLPWNFEDSCFGDFDEYDAEEEKQFFEASYLMDINDYLHRNHMNGYETDVLYIEPELYYAKENPFVRNYDFDDEMIDDGAANDEMGFLADSFVEMQLNSYFLIRDLLEHLKQLYPDHDEEELMEMVRDELTEQTYRSLDDFIDEIEDTDFTEEDPEEEYH